MGNPERLTAAGTVGHARFTAHPRRQLGTYAITTWNYDGARGWLSAKDYADATTGNAGTTGNDYLHPMRENFTIPR